MVHHLFQTAAATIGFWLAVIIFLGVGIAMLKYGADWLVDGASNVGLRLGMSGVMIGLTIVAFGTSAPELVVSVLTAGQGQPEICLGNVIGSNVANIGLILGLTAVITPLLANRNTIRIELYLSLVSMALVWLLAIIGRTLSRWDAVIILAIFSVWMGFLIRTTIKRNKSGQRSLPLGSEDDVEFHGRNPVLDLLLILAGLAMLALGADALVQGAVATANRVGVPEVVVGLTIVAGGTSLPELAVCMVAAIHKKTDLTFGNILGSNIFNAFLILGVACLIAPIRFGDLELGAQASLSTLWIDLPVGIAFCGGLILLLGRSSTLSRFKGWFLFLAYAAYIVTLLFRQA